MRFLVFYFFIVYGVKEIYYKSTHSCELWGDFEGGKQVRMGISRQILN